jgi:hypothetical protein
VLGGADVGGFAPPVDVLGSFTGGTEWVVTTMVCPLPSVVVCVIT